MMSRGFNHCGVLPQQTTLINMDPGTVNTKMLLNGWGPCGIDVEDATDTYFLATDNKYTNEGGLPKYYVYLKEQNPI
jgi:hypothetical protein